MVLPIPWRRDTRGMSCGGGRPTRKEVVWKMQELQVRRIRGSLPGEPSRIYTCNSQMQIMVSYISRIAT